MTHRSALIIARNQYLTAVERNLAADEAYLLSTSVNCSETNKGLAILEVAESGLAMEDAFSKYLEARDAWYDAEMDTTP